ncbi:hypothetical protein ES703_87340 [subsurface metagenome]
MIRLGDVNIGSSKVYAIKAHIYGKRSLDSVPEEKFLFVATSETSQQAVSLSTDYEWTTVTWSGLSLGQDAINGLEVILKGFGMGAGYLFVHAVYVEVFLADNKGLDFVSTIQLDSMAASLTLGLEYDYSAISTPHSFTFQIYNFGTSQWTELSYTSTDNGVWQYFNSDYLSPDYKVYFRFHMECGTNEDFDFYLDQLRFYAETHELSFTSTIYPDSVIGKSLYYSYRLNTSQAVDFSIWDYDAEEWEPIDNNNYQTFNDGKSSLSNTNFDDTNGVVLRFYASNTILGGEFGLDIDRLNIDKVSFSEYEITGIEPYWIEIDYKTSTAVNFDVEYKDDNGYHTLGTLNSLQEATFTATFSPTLLDSRLSLRIISSTPSANLYIDRIVFSSESTDKPSDLIITSDTKYDLYYADLEFDDVPCLVNSLRTNIPLDYYKTNDRYFVFKVSEIDTGIPFIINRLKIANPSHAQNITIVPRDYYHWAGDEIYINIDEVGGFDPVIDKDSTLHVDYAYIYDSWRDNEYVDTQPYVYNFSVSAAQRIEAISFFATFSEIPQIQSWFFGVIDDEAEFKQLASKLYKDVNLLEIQFYDFVSNTWNTTDYVVYDLGDRDARTFGYFIDRTAIDFIRFDMLPENNQIYQLKYRFKIDKNYFNEEYSTKTFFDIQKLTVKLYYKPVQSVVSLNPQLILIGDMVYLLRIIHLKGLILVKCFLIIPSIHRILH